ncbi:MAG: 4-hydroxy-tetrahydrodipicolinate synthase [Halanaerobiales bacterium]
MNGDFGELLTAMVTPFDEKDGVNLPKVKELARFLIDSGSDGLVVLGTTGEVPTLTGEEKRDILKAVVEVVGDEAKIIAGTGSYSTSASIETTRMAEEIGVDGIMAVVPYYNKPPQDGLYQHFSKIANSTELPVMLYNVPGRTSRNLEVSTVSKLSEIKNIVAVKEASGDVSQAADICRRTEDNFKVYSGEDSLTLPILSVGGQGVVSVAAHLVGSKMKKMITAFKNGDIYKAQSLNDELCPVFKGVFITTNPIPVKTALNMLGHEVGGLRSPLLELNNSEKQVLKGILENCDLL